MRFYETDSQPVEVIAEYTVPARYQGYPGVVHGGIIAAIARDPDRDAARSRAFERERGESGDPGAGSHGGIEPRGGHPRHGRLGLGVLEEGAGQELARVGDVGDRDGVVEVRDHEEGRVRGDDVHDPARDGAVLILTSLKYDVRPRFSLLSLSAVAEYVRPSETSRFRRTTRS